MSGAKARCMVPCQENSATRSLRKLKHSGAEFQSQAGVHLRETVRAGRLGSSPLSIFSTTHKPDTVIDICPTRSFRYAITIEPVVQIAKVIGTLWDVQSPRFGLQAAIAVHRRQIVPLSQEHGIDLKTDWMGGRLTRDQEYGTARGGRWWHLS